MIYVNNSEDYEREEDFERTDENTNLANAYGQLALSSMASGFVPFFTNALD